MVRSTETPRQRSTLARTDVVDLAVTKLVQGGEGLAFVDGLPILIAGAAPGDRLRVKIVDRRADYARAEIEEILAAGDDRVAAPCPYYDRCGGCDLQHIDPQRQLAHKVAAAMEALRRIGKLRRLPEPEVVSAADFGYRSRAQVQIRSSASPEETTPASDEAKPSVRSSEQPWAVGFRARRSSEVVDVEHCMVLEPGLQSALERIRSEVSEQCGSPNPGSLPTRLDLVVGDDGRWAAAPLLGSLPRGDVEVTVSAFGRDHELLTDAHAFFQSNRGLAGRLVELALGADQGNSRSVGGSLAWDLYAGVGLFALPLSHEFETVRAVESDRSAVRHLRRNARRRARGRALEVEAATVEKFLVERLKAHGEPKPDLVLVDPPRAGLSKRTRAMLLHLAAPRLRYVSCDPATLARDLGHLSDLYRVERLHFIDLIPQTSHLEAVVALVPADSTDAL